ncbi:MAG: TonB-dependent receptor [Verrucomicrobia bacterium]|nr:TonB-dependent receptor [Verrucomicrobiota bacterium]
MKTVYSQLLCGIVLVTIIMPFIAPVFAQNESEKVYELDPFTVMTDAGNVGYQPTRTNVLTRTNRTIIELPQTVEIVTQEFLQDTSARLMDEAFVYVSNVQVRNSSAGTGPNNILIRGFANGSSFTEGIETGTYRRDMHGYERMEIIKGPASAVQGRGTESGFINFVLKKPIPGAEINDVSFGYNSGKNGKTGVRFTIDKNLTLSEEKGLYGRVAAVYDNHDHFFDFAEFKTAAIYPSLRWVISDNTELFVLGEFMDVDAPARAPGHGFAWIPALYRREIPLIGDPTDPITALNLPENFNIGGPQRGTHDTLASGIFIATHKFNDAIQYRQSASLLKSTSDQDWWDAESNIPAPIGNIPAAFKAIPEVAFDTSGVYIPVQHGSGMDTHYRTNLQGDLNMTYGEGFANFATLVGYAWEERNSKDINLSSRIPTRYSFINLKDPERAWDGRHVEATSASQSRNLESFYEEFGYYIQQDVNLFDDRLLLTGGYREDTGESYSKNYLNGTQSTKTKNTVDSWRAAATFMFTDNFSVYGIKSTQNDPSRTSIVWSDLPAGDPRLLEMITLSPSTELTEFGFKSFVMDQRVTLTLSYYEIITTGRSGNDRVDTTSQAPDTLGQPVFSALRRFVTNGDKGSGIEFSANGKITNKLDVNFAYGTLDTSQPITGGSRPIRHSPDYNGSLFVKYNLHDADNRGWTLRGGVSVIGPFMQQVGGGLGDAGRIQMDGSQHRFDFGAAYQVNDNLSFDIMLKNATNEPYIVTRTNRPRDIRFTVRSSF